MDSNLKNAKSLGRKFNNIKDAIAYAEKLAAEIGLECGVHGNGKRFYVRQGWAQGGRLGSGACVYIARLKTHEQYVALGLARE
jgi:hypothetical protein